MREEKARGRYPEIEQGAGLVLTDELQGQSPQHIRDNSIEHEIKY